MNIKSLFFNLSLIFAWMALVAETVDTLKGDDAYFSANEYRHPSVNEFLSCTDEVCEANYWDHVFEARGLGIPLVIDPNTKDPKLPWFCLNQKLSAFHNLIKLYIEINPSWVNYQAEAGLTLLSKAIFEEDLELVRYVLEKGANPNLFDDVFNITGWILIVHEFEDAVASELINTVCAELGIAEIDRVSDVTGLNPLFSALLSRKFQTAIALIEKGASLDPVMVFLIKDDDEKNDKEVSVTLLELVEFYKDEFPDDVWVVGLYDLVLAKMNQQAGEVAFNEPVEVSADELDAQGEIIVEHQQTDEIVLESVVEELVDESSVQAVPVSEGGSGDGWVSYFSGGVLNLYNSWLSYYNSLAFF